MFKIKICGITSPEDALLAAEAGADAIGLNFYEQSPRYVTPERGGEISDALRTVCENRKPNAPLVVGVFVHPKGLFEIDPKCGDPVTLTWGRLYDTQGVAKFDGFQLHGDEPPELIATMNIPNFPAGRSWLGKVLFPEPPNPIVLIIRAFRCREPNLRGINDYLRECASFADKMEGTSVRKMAGFSTLPHAVLLDAYAPGVYGGTGQVVDWNVVRNERDLLMGLPVILAGGLTPENVAEAIATARPDAVDVASGVESSPGKKDPDKVRRFIAEARRAFAELQRG